MALTKAIYYGKERRKPYRDSRRFDRSCRAPASCGHCRSGRTHPTTKAEARADQDLREYAEAEPD